MAMRLTSTTAPGTVFASREELAEHYGSDWHRYNLKRRQAGLPCVTLGEFQARLSAAQVVQLEKQQKSQQRSQAHLKKKKPNTKNSIDTKGRKKQQQQLDTTDNQLVHTTAVVDNTGRKDTNGSTAESEVAAEEDVEPVLSLDKSAVAHAQDDELRGELERQPAGEGEMADAAHDDDGNKEEAMDEAATEEEEEDVDNNMQVEIDPCRCLFDRHVSATVKDNVNYMHRQYGFFVPDREHLVDLPGLVGYCHEKIQIGHACLWCQQAFATPQACVAHMKAKGHAKVRYEPGIDLEELDVFYDFASANRDFLSNLGSGTGGAEDANVTSDMQLDEDDEDEWEDMSDDGHHGGGDAEDDDDDDDYRGYEEEVGRMGFTITDLGELVFPDGRIIGHRSLKKYYRQNLAPYRVRPTDASPAVRAARIAAGERLWNGRVYNVQSFNKPPARLLMGSHKLLGSGAASLGLGGVAPTSRAGHGILVPASSSSSSALASPFDYSTVSIYRYRAALRKARYGENYGRRLWLRSNTNLNRMDKKANRLANGVSVAHAAR